MSKTANSIKSLRAYYKDRLALPDPEEFFNELMSANDRSIVITIAAFLNDALEWVIAKTLRPLATKEEFDALFGPEKTLSAFSSKIEMAYYMKLIE